MKIFSEPWGVGQSWTESGRVWSGTLRRIGNRRAAELDMCEGLKDVICSDEIVLQRQNHMQNLQTCLTKKYIDQILAAFANAEFESSVFHVMAPTPKAAHAKHSLLHPRYLMVID
jgi:hypothetical protein